MQLTIELPDELGLRVEPEREHLADIIERGLQQRQSELSGLRRELIAFLARGPQPSEILAYRPPASFVERARELLRRGKTGPLNQSEEAELDELSSLDHLMSLIKAEARRHAPSILQLQPKII